ncbi:MAG: Uma2 family endonuclease [Gloeobacterales cyanobacterium]
MTYTRTDLTLQEFLALPEGDIACELIDGKAVPKVSPKLFHSTVQLALLLLFLDWCEGKGRVIQEWAVLLKRENKDWVPVPDLTYVSFERLREEWEQNEACPVFPELVMEIASPEQSIKGLKDKAIDYLNAGVSRVWLVDPEEESITVYGEGIHTQTSQGDDMIQDTLLLGLTLTPKQVFQKARKLRRSSRG